MRADRLLTLLMLLQTRRKVTAQTLARRLEVSERTIYRDLEALGAAGIPVYAERGPRGGWSLLEDYRVNLNRLTESEVSTLFMSGAAGPLADLGLGKAREDALLKLLAALPSVYRGNAERARQRIHLDAAGWFYRAEEVPYLPLIQEAVWNDRRLHLTYQRGDYELVERVVDPYGLVAKASVWYLVACSEEAAGEMRVFRVSRVQAVKLMEDYFDRPEEFDLPAFWSRWSAEFEASRHSYPVKLRVLADYVPILTQVMGDWVQALAKEAGPPGAGGWITLPMVFETLPEARSKLLGFGTSVKVLAPQEWRESMGDFASRIAEFYQ